LKKKILITGATGFIGKNLIKVIPEDYEIYFISRKKIQHKRIKYLKINIFNKEKIKFLINKIKPNYLIHLAWEAQPGKYLYKKSNLKWLDASKNLFLNFSKNKNKKKAILIGSILENDLNKNFFYEKEIDIKNKKDKNNYNVSKIKFYYAAKKIAQKYSTKFVWVRIPWLYGSYEKKERLIPKIIYSLKNNKKMKIFNLKSSINILHVEDIVSIIFLLLNHNISGIFNLVNLKINNINDIVKIITKIMKKEKNKLTFINDYKQLNFLIESKKIKKINYRFKFNLKSGLESLIK
jgi:nucleoside-diphosphate-sugar epimerase